MAVAHNLEFRGADMGHPYPAPGKGTVDKSTLMLELAYHHVIPKNHLVELWNKVVERQLIGSSAPLLLDLEKTVDTYSSMKKANGGRIHEVDIKAVRLVMDKIRNKEIVHDAKKTTLTEWDTFRQIYVWLPGNLFKGPKKRADDPGEAFDRHAKRILPAAHFELLKATDDAIVKYLSNPLQGELAGSAFTGLAKIAKSHLTFHAFDGKQWEAIGTDSARVKP